MKEKKLQLLKTRVLQNWIELVISVSALIISIVSLLMHY